MARGPEVLPVSSSRLVRPESVEEALQASREAAEGCHYYAGGVEVVLAMRWMGLRPRYLVDLKRVPELRGVRSAESQVHLGPLTTHAELSECELVARRLPLLAQACGQVGTTRIRMQGTLGGNFAHGHQHTDPGTAAIIHEGWVDLVGPDGRRSVPVGEFWRAPQQVGKDPDEIIELIRLRPLGAHWLVGHERFEELHRPPTAIVSLAVEPVDGGIGRLRISVGGVPPRPLRLPELEEALIGLEWSDAANVLGDAESRVRDAVDARSDLLGSADFKIALVAGLLRRGLRGLRRAAEEQGRALALEGEEV